MDFLAVADPVTLSPLLSPTVPDLHGTARIYRRARPLLSGDPSANAAYLAEADRALRGTAVISDRAGIKPLYYTHLGTVGRDDSFILFTGHTGPVSSVALGTGPGGQLLLASGSVDLTVRIWDPLTGAPLGEPLTGHTGVVDSVVFWTGPGDRLLLASGSLDGTVRLWDPVTGTSIGETLVGHTGDVKSLSFGITPQGMLLAAVAWGRWVQVWDPVAGAPIGEPFTGHTVASVAFATTSAGDYC